MRPTRLSPHFLLGLAFSWFATDVHAATPNIIRSAAPIHAGMIDKAPETPVEQWLDATTYGAWIDVGSTCTWSPDSSTIFVDNQITQTGICGGTRSRLVTPQRRSSLTQAIVATGEPYYETHKADSETRQRTVYGDFRGEFGATTLSDASFDYVGARNGSFGTPAVLPDGRTTGIFINRQRSNGVMYGSVVSGGFADYQSSVDFILRYTYATLYDQSGKAITTFRLNTQNIGGGGGAAKVYITDMKGNFSRADIWDRWFSNPSWIRRFSLHN